MKRIFILAAICSLVLNAMAIPARPGVQRKLTLADGRTVTGQLRGDENYHFYLMADGTPLVRNSNGMWEPTTPDVVRARHQARAQRRNQHRVARAEKTRAMFQQARRAKAKGATAVNKKRGLVILVNFNDKAFKSTSKREYFEQMCNAEGNPFGRNYGSVHEYFLAQSYGQFDLEFDVVGPYTLTYGMTYYGRDTDASDKGSDAHPEAMIEEACKKADADVNFADYDWDGDGEVDQVYVFYAGYGQSSGASTNTIWPHEWDLESAFYYNQDNGNYSLRLDGVRINTYACGSELYGTTGSTIDGIGTMCHEFSHCLGLPDFYDTTGKYLGMDAWDLMDVGSYNGDGYQPAGYTAYERWFSGWLEPTVLSESVNVTDMPAIQDEPVAYVLMRSGTTANKNGDYYLMYNHQQKGWDATSYGHGMLVLYVRYSATAWEENTVNDKSTQRMTVVPADGDFLKPRSGYYSESNLAGDPWPGTSRRTSFSWMDHTVSNITEKDGLISFRFDGGTATIGAPVINAEACTFTQNTFTAAWTAVDEAVSYTLRYCMKNVEHTVREALLLSEDFVQMTGERDGSVTMADNLDKVLSTAGWMGAYVYTGKQGAKVGSSKNSGYLLTPLLTCATGSVSIRFNASDWANSAGIPDGSGIRFELTDENMYHVSSTMIESLVGEDLVVTFDNVPERFKIRLATLAAGKRFYLSDVQIYDGTFTLEEMDAPQPAPSWIEVAGISGTSYTVQDLQALCTYQYQVQSVSASGEQSGWSGMQTVTLDPANGIVPLVRTIKEADSQLFDLSGRRVRSARPLHGIFVTNQRKVLIR